MADIITNVKTVHSIVRTILMLTVAGKSYSLDTIEHKLLRPTGENRIHFAIVCASISCPRLRNEAYVPARLEEQLADNTRDFFSRSQNFSVRQRTANVSSILKWFAEDFGTSPQAGLASLVEYLPESGKTLVAKIFFVYAMVHSVHKRGARNS